MLLPLPPQNNDTSVPATQDPPAVGNSNRPMLPEPETPKDSEGGDSFPSQPSQSELETPREQPIFVTPTVFRPNTFFIGREKEMKHLHKMLTDRGRRSRGTSSVLIQSMPGGGKSHLARQYVFEHRYHYPGGVFWIRAKSVQELEYGYWDIAKTAGLTEQISPDHNESNRTRVMVRAVQAWLSSIDNWLLVLDGIHFDFPNLQLYVPFAKNTSIIYTSTERTPGEDYQFDNPQVLALDALTKQEAQELLFLEMGKKRPWTQDDLRRAEELVELMDRLPLMIHAAALHLKATREPLAKYLRSYRSRPKVGNLPAYRAVLEQLEHRGAVAALNLMSILAFFGTHVPIEMIGVGVKGLGRNTPVKSSDPSTRRLTLNNTYKTLIAFALVERNENSALSSSNSGHSTRNSVDMAQDSLDILRIHGIVQAFFVDVLVETRHAHFWLERAVCVFLRALRTCDARVDREEAAQQTGSPEDFRRFLIQGQRLLSHLDRLERKNRWPPGLPPCRAELEASLERIQSRIEQLAKRASDIGGGGGSQGSGNNAVVSVFERVNSLSADSSSPPSSSSLAGGNYTGDTDTEPLESPPLYSPTSYYPYNYHVSYPFGEPYTAADDLDVDADVDVDVSRTVTPQPAPTEIFDAITVPDDYDYDDDHDGGGDGTTTTRRVFLGGPDHRTIRRQTEKRYRDRAGSWRAAHQILSDPRTRAADARAARDAPPRGSSSSSSPAPPPPPSPRRRRPLRRSALPVSAGSGSRTAGSSSSGRRRPMLMLLRLVDGIAALVPVLGPRRRRRAKAGVVRRGRVWMLGVGAARGVVGMGGV
ncbi:P-loop containing nucleoside triphosphate hydrolase protein [Xylariaceae sp. FL0804]|nr:P-loop containing nucleoside triphosphate hydrolase protein [Xylariaceae sp. FL0804]